MPPPDRHEDHGRRGARDGHRSQDAGREPGAPSWSASVHVLLVFVGRGFGVVGFRVEGIGFIRVRV